MENFLENFLRFVEKNKSRVSRDWDAPSTVNRYVVKSAFGIRSIEVSQRASHMGCVYRVVLADMSRSVDATLLISQDDAEAAYHKLERLVLDDRDANRKSFIDKFFQ